MGTCDIRASQPRCSHRHFDCGNGNHFGSIYTTAGGLGNSAPSTRLTFPTATSLAPAVVRMPRGLPQSQTIRSNAETAKTCSSAHMRKRYN
jgi:hypothetical protein